MFADKITLTMQETLLVAVAGIAVVIFELAIIAVLIVFLSKIIRALEGKLSGEGTEASEAAANTASSVSVVPAPAAAPAAAAPAVYAAGRTQLIDVDEPTAAVIMALVSNQSGIPLERLAFRSIRGITELVDVDERTAATIMAIVSKESGIPLERLSFKSIRKVEE
ncbi:MAG: hypothetical protein IJD78_02895 [Clostridia bacterium]|nr:hypothetical protein [Clostridia bacterium]